MRHFFRYILSLAVLCCGWACETEIDMNYRNIESKYVVNSYTNSEGSSVTITRTTDMDAPMDLTPVVATSVVITDATGNSHTLVQNESGVYSSQSVAAQSAGESYRLDIDIEGEKFSSSSSVEPIVSILSMEFSQEEIMRNKVMLCNVEVERDINATRYYKYELYLNGERLVWGTGRKDVDAPDPFSLSLLFAVEGEDGVLKTTDEDETPVVEGDDITVAITALDANGYEYFETLSLASQSSSNPVYNFTGDCLGYYVAYLDNTISMPFALPQ